MPERVIVDLGLVNGNLSPERAPADVWNCRPVLSVEYRVRLGSMVDEKGQPLPGVKITLYGGLATRLKGQQAETNQHGEYVFRPLNTGAMTKRDDADDWSLYTGIQLEHPTHASADGKSWWDIEAPRNPGHVQTRDFRMVPGGAIAGTVVDQTSAQPIGKLDLRIKGAKDQPHDVLRYTTTDDKGAVRETALFPGEYDVDVNSPKFSYPVIGHVTIEAGKEAKVTLHYSAAQAAQDAP